MCKPLKEYLAVVREYKDTIVMFIGIAACVFVYCDFRALADAGGIANKKAAPFPVRQ